MTAEGITTLSLQQRDDYFILWTIYCMNCLDPTGFVLSERNIASDVNIQLVETTCFGDNYFKLVFFDFFDWFINLIATVWKAKSCINIRYTESKRKFWYIFFCFVFCFRFVLRNSNFTEVNTSMEFWTCIQGVQFLTSH